MRDEERITPREYKWAWETTREGCSRIPMFLERLDGAFIASDDVIDDFDTLSMLKRIGSIQGEFTWDDVREVAKRNRIHLTKVRNLLINTGRIVVQDASS